MEIRNSVTAWRRSDAQDDWEGVGRVDEFGKGGVGTLTRMLYSEGK